MGQDLREKPTKPDRYDEEEEEERGGEFRRKGNGLLGWADRKERLLKDEEEEAKHLRALRNCRLLLIIILLSLWGFGFWQAKLPPSFTF